MKTIEQYRENNFPIIPCYKNSRKPIGDKWQETRSKKGLKLKGEKTDEE